MQRVLITGAGGQVGWEISSRLSDAAEILALDRQALNLADPGAIRSVIGSWKPTIIVNAAAYTAVDAAETDAAMCRTINAEAPEVMAAEAASLGALMVHFSTDYVFDGAGSRPYVETDPTRPLGEYGRSKLAGEEAVRTSGASHLIFRLCWVYAARGKNFYLTMRRLAAERDVLRVVSDQKGTPTWAGTIADATIAAINARQRADDPESFDGTYHLAARGAATWHDFARTILDSMNAPAVRLDAISTAEYPTPARRPSCSVLDVSKFESTFSYSLPDWQDAFREMLTATS